MPVKKFSGNLRIYRVSGAKWWLFRKKLAGFYKGERRFRKAMVKAKSYVLDKNETPVH